MLLDLSVASAHAQRLHQDSASLRDKDREIEDILTNQHVIPIPESMKPRSMIIYSNKGAEKVNLAKTLLTDPKGPRVTVAQQGTGASAERNRDRVQEWLTGAFTCVEGQFVEFLFSHAICEDNLVKSRAGAWVLPNPKAWDGCPYDDTGTSSDSPPQDDRYARAKTMDEVAAVANEQASENERRARKYSRRDLQTWQAQHFPIRVRIANPAGTHLFVDDEGLCEVVEIAEMSVRQVLTDYQNEHGEPLAQQLAQDAGWFSWEAPSHRSMTLTDVDVCTLVTRADRTDMQVLLTDIGATGNDAGQRYHRRQHGGEEMVWEGPHGLKRVPFAYFPGRTRNSREPSLRFHGFLDPVVSDIYALDTLRSQLASGVWQTAWPNPVLEMDKGSEDTPGAGDRMTDTSYPEGTMLRLPPGAHITTFTQIPPEAYRLLALQRDWLEQQIDKNTISPASYGASGADSGYLQAQLAASGQLNLEPFEAGQSFGYGDLASLLLECAACVLTKIDADDIPVRYTSEEGTRLVTLSRDLAEQQWVIAVEVKAKPVGGLAALVNTHTAMKAQGWISDEEAMRQQGVRNITRMQAQVSHDRVMGHPSVNQAIVDAIVGQVVAALAAMKTPPLPQNPVLPAAALGAGWQSPEILARLGGVQAEGAMGSLGAGGMPNPMAGNMNPAPPSVTDAMQRNMMGVPRPPTPYGQGQAMPGGAQRIMAAMN